MNDDKRATLKISEEGAEGTKVGTHLGHSRSSRKAECLGRVRQDPDSGPPARPLYLVSIRIMLQVDSHEYPYHKPTLS